MKNKYEIIMYWSEEDDCYIAEIPELSGCIAHGNTEYEALEKVNQAKELWIKTAEEFGDEIPEPKGRLVFA
jgi:predicted RNase H-like HicB family nuclease